MHTRTKNKLIGLGIDLALIQKIGSKHLTVDGMRGLKKAALETIGFTSDEADIIVKKVNRSSIDPLVFKNIIKKSGGMCCFCENGISNIPYQIHHIEEYHISQDHNESNLLLVCPTHHSVIHQFKITIDQQLEVKRKWENLWIVVEEFQKGGITFPFGAIESVDYKTKGSITEIFKYTAPKPSVCLELAKNELAKAAQKKLTSENNLIVTGSSGSGKSTFVLGVAGLQNGNLVYKYTTGQSDSLKACQEILQFISKTKNCILIIDDANTKIVGEHIEKILNASTSSVQLIVVKTRNDFKGDDNLETHFLDASFRLEWSELKYSVKSSLIDNEYEVIDYLKDKFKDDSSHFPLGYGQLDTSLDFYIDKYFNSSNTVWESLFLLGGGLGKVNGIWDELFNSDRFDIVLLYLSIKQISKFEAGCSLEELLELYSNDVILKSKGVPEKDWLKEQLDNLCFTRFLKNERGRYKTIHRQFARKFLEISYVKANVDCCRQLDAIFYDFNNAQEIVILWSWLQNSGFSSYLSKWYNPAVTDWNQIVNSACATNIETLGILADLMNQTARVQNDVTVKNAWKNKQKEVASLVNNPKATNLYNFKKIILTLKNHVEEDIKSLCDLIDSENIARIIKECRPEDYDYLDRVLNELWNYHPDLVRGVAEKLDHTDFINCLARIEKGKIYQLDKIVSFYRTFVIDYKRSDVKIVADTVGSLLSGCKLSEMHFPTLNFGLIELQFYDVEMANILQVLNVKKLANELSTSNPRCWRPLLDLRMFFMSSNTEKLSEIINHIDLNQLTKNLERYYMDSSYEFRVLIHFLANGTEAKKEEIAIVLEPLVEKLFESGRQWIDKDVMQAFNKLSSKRAKPLAKKFNIGLEKIKKMPTFAKVRKIIDEDERSGEDYVLEVKHIDKVANGDKSL